MKIKTLNLKKILVESELTLSELARKSNVSRNTISSVCNGKTCSFMTAGKIAKALNVSLTDIAEE